MIHHTLQYIFVFALLFGSGCSSSYDPAAEPFKASFPGTPVKNKKTITANGMTLIIDTTTYDFGSGAFLVTFSDYSPGHVQRNGAADVLANVAKGGAAQAGGTITSQKAISLGNHPGLEVQFADAANGMDVRNRIYLVGDRLYQVMAVTKPTTDRAKIDQFLDSFEVK